MNLHITPDNKFINSFRRNLDEIGICDNNKFVVKANTKTLQYINPVLPHAAIGSDAFEALVGDTFQYDCVYIHLFSPMMYRWVARHHFKKVCWLVWGADIYELPFIHYNFYEPLTYKRYIRKRLTFINIAYKVKSGFMNLFYKNNACAKIDNVFTWMNSEFNFIKRYMPVPKAQHTFFYYENDLPYTALDKVVIPVQDPASNLKLIIGHSASPMLNHLDAVDRLVKDGIQADLYFPVSYGDPHYLKFLKKALASYSNGRVIFIEQYMKFDEYIAFLASADGMIMNNVRPQGYGNVLMIMYLGKPVFLNERNTSIPDLERNGIAPSKWSDLKNLRSLPFQSNKSAISSLFSHDMLLKIYQENFSAMSPKGLNRPTKTPSHE